jgi:hypothetical protein
MLRFRKTLGIQSTPKAKVFFETRRLDRDDSLLRILREEYGVSPEALPALEEAFRAVNPGVDPERLSARNEVRIPFKVEETLSSAPREEEAEPVRYEVRPGDSLWRILASRQKVPRGEMEAAMAAVRRANPQVKNWNHLVPGQRLLIPRSSMASRADGGGITGAERDVLALLTELGCRVAERGRTFLPVARGRSLQIDHRDFPAVTGIAGRTVLFDSRARMSAAMIRAIEDSWDYAVLQGREGGPEALLQRVLPRMSFHELSEEPRKVPLGGGLELLAEPRWTVVPRPEDAWDGRVHLIFPAGVELAPEVASVALRAGVSLHVLGGRKVRTAGERNGAVPELALSDASGAGLLLTLLGVPHRVRPEVSCDLGGGVSYLVRPELTFRHGGVSYAIPPAEPPHARDLLERSGYVAVGWSRRVKIVDRLADLLGLLSVQHRRATLEVPTGRQPLRLRLEGVLVEEERLVKALYPNLASLPKERRTLFMTGASVDPGVAGALRADGFLPWVVRER